MRPLLLSRPLRLHFGEDLLRRRSQPKFLHHFANGDCSLLMLLPGVLTRFQSCDSCREFFGRDPHFGGRDSFRFVFRVF